MQLEVNSNAIRATLFPMLADNVTYLSKRDMNQHGMARHWMQMERRVRDRSITILPSIEATSSDSWFRQEFLPPNELFVVDMQPLILPTLIWSMQNLHCVGKAARSTVNIELSVPAVFN